MPATLGITEAVLADTLVIPFNDPDALEPRLGARGDVAAFIVEPVMENIGDLSPRPGYLEAVREITRRHGTLLIFDEVKTGHHRRLRRGHAALRRDTRPRRAGQVHRRRAAARRVRRQSRGDGADRRRPDAAPRHLQRQPARDGGGPGGLAEICTEEALDAAVRLEPAVLSRHADAIIDRASFPPTRSGWA